MAAPSRSDVGALGERLAEEHLLRSGYRVLDRNFRTRSGELDLVATAPGCVVFCEVRARVSPGAQGASGAGGPLDSIGPRKRRQLRRMAREWLAARAADRLPDRSEAGSLRFDAIGVVVGADGSLRSLVHVEDAF